MSLTKRVLVFQNIKRAFQCDLICIRLMPIQFKRYVPDCITSHEVLPVKTIVAVILCTFSFPFTLNITKQYMFRLKGTDVFEL